MLDFVRKHAKSWLVKVALGLIIVVFIFWGGYSYRSRHETEVAQVGERFISVGEFNTAYSNMMDNYRRQLGPAASEEMLRKLDLKKQTLESLITQALVIQGAEELGLSATTDEIRRKVLEIPGLINDGKFDKQRYENILRQMHMAPDAFERQIAQEIAFRKVESFVSSRAVVTEDEVLTDHHFNRDQVRLAYVLFDPKSFEDRVTMDEAALRAFHDANASRYMEPEKREIAHVLVSADDLARDVRVSEAEVRMYYDDHLSLYKHEKEVRARHILFKVKPDAPAAEVEKARAEALKVLAEARKGKDFAELAGKYSQDEGSAKQGGDLGWFDSKKVVPEFSEAAFSLKPGQISDPVRSSFGFHIIKVEDAREPRTSPFEEVKQDIEKNLRLQTGQDMAFKKSRELRDLAYARKDVEKAAEEMKLPVAGRVWIDRTPDTGPFPPQLKTKLFELSQGDISDPFELPRGFEVAQVKSIKLPEPIAFEQAKDRVAKDYRSEQSKLLARQKASEVLNLAREKNSLAEAAKQQNLNVRQSEPFSRQEPDKDLKLLRGEGLSKVFGLRESTPFPDSPLELGNRFLVCQLQGRTPAGQPSPVDISTISARLLQQKQATLWQAWIFEMRKSIKVELFKEL